MAAPNLFSLSYSSVCVCVYVYVHVYVCLSVRVWRERELWTVDLDVKVIIQAAVDAAAVVDVSHDVMLMWFSAGVDCCCLHT